MKKINLLFLTAVVVALTTALISLTSSASDGKKIETPTCCKKKTQECGTENRKSGSGELIMETMSRQFISISPL